MASLPPCWAGSPSEASSPVTGRSMPILMVPLIVWVVVPPPPQAARIRPVTASPASNLGLFIRFLLLPFAYGRVDAKTSLENCEPVYTRLPYPCQFESNSKLVTSRPSLIPLNNVPPEAHKTRRRLTLWQDGN